MHVRDTSLIYGIVSSKQAETEDGEGELRG